ncbi:MAG: hypothetical protein BV456_13270 [Thermoplasmata archaeon M8B2D]|nr:MAG: hypothetical protein BV456_13270 [Thermoplasmata archaeon M8B2D]
MLESILERSGIKDVMIIIIASIAIIGIWRGVWNLLDAYFLTDSFIGSQIVSIVFGVWLLIILSRYGDEKRPKK